MITVIIPLTYKIKTSLVEMCECTYLYVGGCYCDWKETQATADSDAHKNKMAVLCFYGF